MKNLLVIHIVLLLLAISNLTLITFLFDGSWSFSLGQFSQKDSFGKPYEFEYSLIQVFAYIACYASGFFFYTKCQKVKPNVFSKIALLVCLVGFGTFIFELSHWVVNFNYSIIISFPIKFLSNVNLLNPCFSFQTGTSLANTAFPPLSINRALPQAA